MYYRESQEWIRRNLFLLLGRKKDEAPAAKPARAKAPAAPKKAAAPAAKATAPAQRGRKPKAAAPVEA